MVASAARAARVRAAIARPIGWHPPCRTILSRSIRRGPSKEKVMNARGAGVAVVAWLVFATPEAAPAATPCDFAYPSDAGVAWDCRRIAPGESLEGLFGERWRDVARFNRMDRRHAWPGARVRVPRDLASVAGFDPMPPRYAPAESAAKFVLIDLGEQFLAAYEHGRLVLSFPVASGRPGHETPAGDFRIDAADPRHASSRYPIEGTNVPYPMPWALRFHRTSGGVSYWIHGRDLPGTPASHGCVGLVDEAMQRRAYGRPAKPEVEDARVLFAWVVGSDTAPRGTRAIPAVPLRIVGAAPRAGAGSPALPLAVQGSAP
jgi:hypothetical protein